MTTTITPPEINPNRIKKKRVRVTCVACRTSNSNSNSNSTSYKIGIRIPKKWRFFLRRNVLRDIEKIAFPVGMSIAALFVQAMEMKDLTSIDYLSTICTSAVRESLTNVYGQKFEAFAIKFEKSFESTLNTLRLIRNSEVNSKANQSVNHKIPAFSEASLITEECCSRNDDVLEGSTVDSPQYYEANEIDDEVTSLSGNRELVLHEIVSSQLARLNQTTSSNQSEASGIEKLAAEQKRANEIKCVELSLTVPLKQKELQQKDTENSLKMESNYLKRVGLNVGVKAISLKAEKFKTQIEEAKHGELRNMCADYLVTGLIIMSCCFCCGVYTFSSHNLRRLTESCYTPQEFKFLGWSILSFNSGLHNLSCQLQVYSRMIFGGLMIGAIASALVRRSDFANKSMPITFILLLAVLCGYVGKLCVSTFGGNGYTWLSFWEVLCILHFLAIIYNSRLYFILYGAVEVCQGTNYKPVIPFWVRRLLFRFFLLVIPVCCGLLPFASASKWWKEHISHWIVNLGSHLLNQMMTRTTN